MKLKRVWGWGVALLLFGAGMALMFQGALWHGGSLGDNSDGGIVLAILEHWVRVFTGRAADWRSPGWYWPAPHVLGLSDSLFLLALPYAAARAAGAGWFGANDLALATLAAAGYWGTVGLTRRLGVPVAIGSVVAFIWSFGAVPLFKLGHAQTYTVQLAPIVGLFWLAGWRGRAVWAAAAGVLVGLMFLTAAQTPWFLGLETGLAVLVAALLGWRRIPWVRGLRVSAWFSVGLAAGMVPFILLYRDSFGLVRDFSAAHFYSGQPGDLLNVPPSEWMWFGLLERIGVAGGAGRPDAEVALGLTPVLAVAAVVALPLMLWRHAVLASACLAAGLLGPCMAIVWGEQEPWWLIFQYVPGANAVRTPFRIELAAHFFVCLGLAMALARAAETRQGWVRVALAVLAAILVGEQWGAAPSGRENAATAWLNTARRPDFPCQAFYLLPNGGTGPWHQYQSDAMLLSQKLGMPTVNGNSSFYPEGWAMPFTEQADYKVHALEWIDAHGARAQVCGADPRRGEWVPGVAPLTARPAPATPAR